VSPLRKKHTENGLFYAGLIAFLKTRKINDYIFRIWDDVVADWMPAARAIVNRNWNYGERIPDEDWNKVKAKARFYRDLPIKDGAHDLVNYCRDLKAEGTNRRPTFSLQRYHMTTVYHLLPMIKYCGPRNDLNEFPYCLDHYSYDKHGNTASQVIS
jgi:hypothetical protein